MVLCLLLEDFIMRNKFKIYYNEYTNTYRIKERVFFFFWVWMKSVKYSWTGDTWHETNEYYSVEAAEKAIDKMIEYRKELKTAMKLSKFKPI